MANDDPKVREPDGQPAAPAAEAPPAESAAPNSERAGLRFLLAHPAHALALGLGSGLLRPGPGTWGTALAWAIFSVLAPGGAADPATALIIVAVALIVGTWATEHTAAMLGEADPSTIVVDEMVAFWLVLVMLPTGAHWFVLQVAAFVLFRFFDITKPPPIGSIDRRWKNAFGVMADDLVAAFYTLVVIALLMRLWTLASA
jgi:phosphatidylglycerophosphatase A